MAVTYTNIWYTKILDQLRGLLKTEYPSISVYISKQEGSRGSIYFEVDAVGQNLVRTSHDGFTNDYFFTIDLYFMIGATEKAYKDFFNYVNRTEQLLFNNRNYTVSSDIKWYDGTVDSINVNSGLSTDEMVRTATINFSCRYGKV